MNRNLIRLLVTLILTAACALGVVGSALASTWALGAKSSVTVSTQSIAKPGARPTNGEPDGGQTIITPSGTVTTRTLSPMGGMRGGFGRPSSDWTQWIWANWITLFRR